MSAYLRFQVVAGPSARLRDEALAPLVAAWTGAVKRVIEPDRPADLLVDLDTPSLFGDSAATLWVVRADGPWLKTHGALLAPLVGTQLAHGALIIVTDELDGRSALAKALAKAGAVQVAGLPPKGEEGWLRERLLATHPAGATDMRAVVGALLDIYGADADALLGACELLSIYHDDQPVTLAGVNALFAGVAEKPVWDVTGAILDGQPRRAVELIRAGRLGPEQVLGSLASEIRRLLACCASSDDAEAARLSGAKGKPNLFYARRRASALGAGPLIRLLNGVVQAARQARQSGSDPELVIELLVLHAQRVVRPAQR